MCATKANRAQYERVHLWMNRRVARANGGQGQILVEAAERQRWSMDVANTNIHIWHTDRYKKCKNAKSDRKHVEMQSYKYSDTIIADRSWRVSRINCILEQFKILNVNWCVKNAQLGFLFFTRPSEFQDLRKDNLLKEGNIDMECDSICGSANSILIQIDLQQ